MPRDPRLTAAHVLVVGSGRLAAAVRSALAASGIGRVSVARDGEPGAAGSDETVFAPGRTFDLLLDVDLLVEASDHRATRYLGNDAATIRGIPMVWGSVFDDTGRTGVAWDERGLDYRDVDPETPDTRGADGPDSAAPDASYETIGTMMAARVVDLLTDSGSPELGRVAAYDARIGRVSETVHRREPGAPRPGSLEERTAMPEDAPTHTVTATALAAELGGAAAPLLLDVRQDWEFALAALPGAKLIPLGELSARLDELDRDAPVVAYCHHGVRSGRALDILERAGFTRARHLVGGIDAWVDEVDPSLPRY